ncbi:hypothetical protein B484DRAFT_427770 [Ochromonadaceae sp. CCMP2298]|nr:hypothetical protein B484DRAFT_427770 [Ochromonadaceae sp. CCMP2298]
MNLLWGPSKPRFIAQGLAELDNIVSESLRSGADDVVANMHAHQSSLSKSVDYCRKIPVQFINEKKNQMLMVDEMSMEKNGDMVRPQVKAVLDLLVSGIEIDSDFGKGYESLMVATQSKAVGCTYELQHFYSRYSNHENPLGIDYSAALTMGRIDQRRQEVVALLDASDAHLVADHSRLDVLLGAGEKDIEEWASLTLQLVENAFNNAEQSYLSNLWPTPPTTPRLELLAEDEDRVGQLKALLAVTHDGNLAVRRPGGVGGGGGAAAALALAQPEPGSAEEYALAILGGQLDDDSEVQDQLRVRQKETRRVEKESRRLEKEKIKHEAELKASALVPPKVKPEETRELQEGWFECCTAENYTYYFNPTTEESLWQLPLSLLRPKAKDELLIETPRDLLMLSDENQYAEEVIPLRMVSASYSLHIILDPAVLMSQIAEEARAAVALAVDTALDVTTVIRGRKGRNEKTIAALLGDKFNPLLRKDPFEEGDNRGVDVDEEEEGVELTADGRLISDSGGPGPDPEMAQMLAELGLGSQSEYEGGYEGGSGAGGGGGLDVAIIPPQVLPSVAQEIAAELTPPNQTQWLNLGLGATQGEGGDSSDEEGYRDQAIQRRAESRYAQSRETDQMGREDEMSIQFENYEENSNCNDFLHLLQQISATQTATLDNKVQLEALGRIIKPQNLVDIMDTLKTSWRKLDDIIRETEARHLARQALQARVQTEEGMARQQTILEHSEDIEEMQDFLHVAGLAKTAAKRVATELVLQNISTPKKLAKIWSRQHITLSALVTEVEDVDIDEDEGEEGYEEGEGLGTLPSTLRRQSSRAFSYTKDGYKSFANGWVEGQSEEGHAYFWNITSGESSWTLPGAREGDEEELIDDHRETVGVEGEWGGEEKVPVHEPSNTFAHSYEYDPEAYTDYPEGGYQDGSEYYQGSQLQVEQHAYHDAYAYDNTAYDTEAVYYDEAGHPYHYDAQGNAYYAETAPYTPYTDPQTDPTTHPHYPYPTAPHHASAPHPDHPHPDQV